MKPQIPILFFFAAISLHAENWLNHTSTDYPDILAASGEILWIGSYGGLIEYNTTTKKSVKYTHANSLMADHNMTDICPDKKGGIWVASRYGVAYLSSQKTWTSYICGKDDFPSGTTSAISSDTAGGAWVTLDQGKIVNISSSGTITVYTKDDFPAIANQYFSSCAVDSTNRLWVATESNGVVSFTGAEGWKHITSDQFSEYESAVDEIFVDKSDTVWFALEGGALIKLNGDSFEQVTSTPNDEYIGGISQNPETGDLWLGLSGSGVAKLTSVPEMEPYYFPEDIYPSVRDIQFDNTGLLWVATDDGLFSYSKAGNWDKPSYDSTSIPNNRILCLTPDPDGGMWTGTEGGAAKYKDGSWTVYTTRNTLLPGENVYSIQIQGSTVWFGTDYGLAALTGNEWKVYKKESHNLLSNNVTDLLVQGDTLWIGQYGYGLVKFVNEQVVEIFNIVNSDLPGNEVVSLALDSAGALWVGTEGSGLAKKEGGTWTPYESNSSGLPSDDVYALAMESNGTKWIGNTGLTRFSAAQTWKSWQPFTSDFPGLLCVGITIAQDGKKWLATYGLSSFDGTTFTVYNRAETGLPGDQLSCVAIDKQGYIWAGTQGQGIGTMEYVSSPVRNSGRKVAVQRKNTETRMYDILGRRVSQRESLNSRKGPAGIRIIDNGAVRKIITVK